MRSDFTQYKVALEEERMLLEEELGTVGEKNTDVPDHWDPKAEDMDVDKAEITEQADAVEAYGENVAILARLQERYTNVIRGLQAIEDDTYGFCDICGEKIETERLNANPAAFTCIAHREQ